MPVIKVICAYCGCELGYKHCTPEQDGMVSHGVCQKCSEIENAKIDEMIKAGSWIKGNNDYTPRN